MVYLASILAFYYIGVLATGFCLDRIIKTLPRPEWSLGVDYEMRILGLWPVYVLRAILAHRRKVEGRE